MKHLIVLSVIQLQIYLEKFLKITMILFKILDIVFQILYKKVLYDISFGLLWYIK
jgi:hypothetical protein